MMATDTYYLSIKSRRPKDAGYIAVISQGHPQRGDKKVVLLSFALVNSKKEAEDWYKKMMTTKPWEKEDDSGGEGSTEN